MNKSNTNRYNSTMNIFKYVRGIRPIMDQFFFI